MDENKLYVPSGIANSLPAMVRNELAKLPAQKQEEFVEEFKRNGKSIGLAYVFFLFLAAHYGYMGKWGMQLLFWFTLGGFWVWWIIDIFRMSGMIQNYNKDIAMDAMRNLKAVS